jgi:transposase
MIPSSPVIMGAKMRGSDERNEALFSYVNLEDRVPARHPLRLIREIVNGALARLDDAFDTLYAADGRPSIAPERLLRAALIQILFSVRSERQLMEQMQYNLLFRWFVGLGIDDPVWVPTVFSKNRDRLLTTDIARQFLAAILADKAVAPLLSDEHFSVDGTLIKAWASMKSFQPKEAANGAEPAADDAGPGQAGGGASTAEPAASGDANPAQHGDAPASEPAANGDACPAQHGGAPASVSADGGDAGLVQDGGASTIELAASDGEASGQNGGTPAAEQSAAGRNAEVDFHGQKRSNETHASRTDPEARLYRKGPGKEAKLCFMGHALMENRNGLVVDACLTQADGHAEREAALAMVEPRADRPGRITLGADKGYDAEDFVNELRSMNVTPHVAAKKSGSAIDGRTTRHAGYAVSQRIRKRIEEVFGWGKTVGPLAQTMLRGAERVGAQFTFTVAGYNLARLPKLLAA